MMWRDISSAPIPCPHLLANKWNVSFSPEEPAKQFQPWRCRHELRLRAITHAAKAMQHHKEKKGKTTQARSGCIPWEAYKAYERRRLAINEKAVAAANSQQSRQRSGFTWPMGNAAGSSSMSQHTEEMRKQQQRQEPQPATGEERRIMNLAAIAARASRLWRQRHEVVMLAPTSCLHYCCLEHSEGVQVGLGGVSQQSCCVSQRQQHPQAKSQPGVLSPLRSIGTFLSESLSACAHAYLRKRLCYAAVIYPLTAAMLVQIQLRGVKHSEERRKL
eukprot:scaffold311004_cov19-Tisochrysis_lutea.AAC.1